MIINYRKHSKRIKPVSLLTLIVIGLLSLSFAGCVKEEKGEQQDDIINRSITDASKTSSSVLVDKGLFIIEMQKEGEIWIEGERVDITSIKSRIEDFKNKYPDGNVMISCDKDFYNKKATDAILEQVRAAKLKSVVVAASKEE